MKPALCHVSFNTVRPPANGGGNGGYTSRSEKPDSRADPMGPEPPRPLTQALTILQATCPSAPLPSPVPTILPSHWTPYNTTVSLPLILPLPTL